MEQYKIVYTTNTVDDLDGIFDYTSDDNRGAAIKMLERLEKVILKLGGFPRMGSVLSSDDFQFIETGYRKIVVHPYIIFYRISKNVIYIARVLHSRQDWMKLIFDSGFEGE